MFCSYKFNKPFLPSFASGSVWRSDQHSVRGWLVDLEEKWPKHPACAFIYCFSDKAERRAVQPYETMRVPTATVVAAADEKTRLIIAIFCSAGITSMEASSSGSHTRPQKATGNSPFLNYRNVFPGINDGMSRDCTFACTGDIYRI